jgi:hypothetical protein
LSLEKYEFLFYLLELIYFLYFILVILALFIATTIAMVNADEIEGEFHASKIEVAAKFVHFIEKMGLKAWHFLECLGWDAALKCAEPILGTLILHDVADAVALVKCEAPKMIKCAPVLKK